MKAEHMVHMVNQIALNFGAYPHDDAVNRTAEHLKMFWERRMKQQLYEYVDAGAAGMNEIALEAAKKLRTLDAVKQ